MVKGPVIMSYGYSPPTSHASSASQGNKLFHIENRTSRHHQWQPLRPPPPNYEVFPTNPSPPPPTLTLHQPGSESNPYVSNTCMCATCSRPPQYHPPSLPHHTLPHYSSQQSWPPHQPFNSPVGESSSHSEFHQGTSWSPGMATMAPYERNNNEPSMVPPNRYGQIQDPNRYMSIQDSHRYSSASTDSRHMHIHDSMPPDPREWTSSDVYRWIQWASFAFKLKVIPHDRFQMNGKALCLMDLSMFIFRVPDGGERLYDDFQTRLKKALCQDQPPKLT